MQTGICTRVNPGVFDDEKTLVRGCRPRAGPRQHDDAGPGCTLVLDACWNRGGPVLARGTRGEKKDKRHRYDGTDDGREDYLTKESSHFVSGTRGRCRRFHRHSQVRRAMR